MAHALLSVSLLSAVATVSVALHLWRRRRRAQVSIAVLAGSWSTRWRLGRALRRTCRTLVAAAGERPAADLVLVQQSLGGGRLRGDATVLPTERTSLTVIQLALTCEGRGQAVDDILAALADQYLRVASDGVLLGRLAPGAGRDGGLRSWLRSVDGAAAARPDEPA